MRITYKLLGFLSVFSFLASHRAEAHANLIANEGFEEFSSFSPKQWSMPNQLASIQNIERKKKDMEKRVNEESCFTVSDALGRGELYIQQDTTSKPLLPPTKIMIKDSEIFQREALITWDASGDSIRSWEVWVKNTTDDEYKLYKVVKENKCMLEHLIPNTSISLKVRTLCDGKMSEFSSIKTLKTKSLDRERTDPTRTPFLRTIEKSGNSSRRINAYFNDIAADDAVITYTIDGKPFEPKDSWIVFPNKGTHWLVIIIDEKDGNKWKLSYRVNVTD